MYSMSDRVIATKKQLSSTIRLISGLAEASLSQQPARICEAKRNAAPLPAHGDFDGDTDEGPQERYVHNFMILV